MENNEFPNGFGLPLPDKIDGKFPKGGLFKLLGISKERLHELTKEVNIAIIKFADQNYGTSMPETIQYLAKFARTPAELAFVMYELGIIAERADARNRAGRGLNLLLGGMMKLPKGQSESGEEPDIEELIRRSKRINRDRKDEEEED